MKQYTLWSKEEIEKIKDLAGKISFTSMSKLFNNRTPSGLQKKSIKLGLSSNIKFKKYTKNENIWEIPTLENCYWAGFFCADGCILKNSTSNNYSFVVSLASKDLEHLKKLKEFVEYSGEIKNYSRKNYKKETLKYVSTLSICSIRKWAEDLKRNFNIVTNKTFRLGPPNLQNDELKLAYIIGYLDGDGWLCLNSNKRALRIAYVSSSYAILIWIKSVIEMYFKLKTPKVYKVINKNYYTYTIADKNSPHIFNKLKSIDVPKLSRKWENPEILNFINSQPQSDCVSPITDKGENYVKTKEN